MGNVDMKLSVESTERVPVTKDAPQESAKV